MGKNDRLINSLKTVAARNRDEHIRTASERDTVQIYAAMAIALWNTLDIPDEEKQEAIATVFAESQAIWTECITKGFDMAQQCEDITGIDVKNGC